MERTNNFCLLTIVSLMSLMGFSSLDIIFPSLPSMTKIFNVDVPQIQLTISFYLLGYGVSQLIYGPLSDLYGRKPIILTGTGIYLGGSAICLFATFLPILIFGRLIQGLGVGACALLSRVILRDRFEGTHMAKNTSYVSAVIIAGVSLAPVVGGLIQDSFNYKGNFLFMLIYGVVFLLIVCKLLPETNFQKNPDLTVNYVLKSYKNILKTKGFLAYTSLTGISLSLIILSSLYNPFFIQENLGYSPTYYGVLITIISSGEFIGASINSRCVERFGINTMIMLGFLSIGVACILLALLNLKTMSLIGILLPAALIALGTGFIFANAISAAYSKFERDIGAVGAVFGFFQVTLTVFISQLSSSFKSATPIFLACVLMVLCISGVIILFVTSRKKLLTQNI